MCKIIDPIWKQFSCDSPVDYGLQSLYLFSPDSIAYRRFRHCSCLVDSLWYDHLPVDIKCYIYDVIGVLRHWSKLTFVVENVLQNNEYFSNLNSQVSKFT